MSTMNVYKVEAAAHAAMLRAMSAADVTGAAARTAWQKVQAVRVVAHVAMLRSMSAADVTGEAARTAWKKAQLKSNYASTVHQKAIDELTKAQIRWRHAKDAKDAKDAKVPVVEPDA